MLGTELGTGEQISADLSTVSEKIDFVPLKIRSDVWEGSQRERERL